MPYNVFDKPIGESLTEEDLNRLIERNVQEGLFVEYQRDFLENHLIARSLASFANTLGGWYVVGVVERDHSPVEIAGFNLADHPDPTSKIRDIVRTHIDPAPIFFPAIVPLGSGRAVLALYIPADQETPFVTKDGRIYRRTSDSSRPLPETHRHTIDRLVDRGRDISKRFELFCRDDSLTVPPNPEQTWLRLFLSPYPTGMIEKFEVISQNGIHRLLEISRKEHQVYFNDRAWLEGNVPLNCAQPTPNSVILRQGDPQKVVFNSPAIELFVDGRAKVLMPVPYFRSQSPWINNLASPRAIETLRPLTLDPNARQLRFVDVRLLLQAVALMLNYYLKWLGEIPWQTDFKAAAMIEGANGVIAFVDSEEWAVHVGKCGPPLTLRNKFWIPEDLGNGLMIGVDEKPGLCFTMCLFIGLGLGLPPELLEHTLLPRTPASGPEGKNGA